MTPPVLEGRQLHKSFPLADGFKGSKQLLTALDGVSIAVSAGETVGIAGESGCGKSTMGKILAGLIPPSRGDVLFNGENIRTITKSEYQRFRNETQMIFQDPFSSLNPRMRIGDIIAEPLELRKTKETVLTPRIAAEQIMASVGLAKEQYNRFPHEFSGGQRQRIGIARSLAASPRILIADEPVSALDISIQAQIINLLLQLRETYKLSLVVISHDLSVLRHLCDRIVVMYLGTVVEQAPAASLFSHPLHPYTEALVSAMPCISGSKTSQRIILSGDVPSLLHKPSGCRFHPRCPSARPHCSETAPLLEEKKPGHSAACHFCKCVPT